MVIALMVGTGCGKRHMQKVDPGVFNTSISEDEAVIVFFRGKGPFFSSGVAIARFAFLGPIGYSSDATNFVLELEENGNLKEVVLLEGNSKFLHKTTPGKHLYVAARGGPAGGDANFLEAELEAGKIYYVYISHHFGGTSGRVAFVPVPVSELASEEFLTSYANLDWYENKRGRLDYGKAYANYKWFSARIAEYPTVSLEGKALMGPEYGTDTPIQ